MLPKLTLDVPTLQLLLWIVGFLFLVSIVRWIRLSAENRRMRRECPKLEKQITDQQHELTGIQQEAASLRAKLQRQFDALRSDLAVRYQQSEQGNHHAQKKLDEMVQETLEAAQTRIAALEARLAAKPALTATAAALKNVILVKPAAPAEPPPHLPSLPSMETLRLQALEEELAAVKAELASSRQQTAGLQRSLLLARRRHSPEARKAASRGAPRGA